MSAKSTAKFPVVTMLFVVILGVWLGLAGAGGGVYLLVKSGRIPASALAGTSTRPTGAAATHSLVLEPILVNLADEGGHAYLRLGMTLDVADDGASGAGSSSSPVVGGSAVAKPEKGSEGKPSETESAVRDTVLTVLGQQTSASLLGPDGKEHLKLELKEAIAKNNPRLNVKDVFFTDFLVQI